MTESQYEARLRQVAADQMGELNRALIEYAEQAERLSRRLMFFATDARSAQTNGKQLDFRVYEARRGMDVLESAMGDIQRFQDRLIWTQGLIDIGRTE